MSEKEFIWRMRLNIYHQADKKKKTITYLCKKYEVSRSWFYKWKKRRNRYGDEGLRPKIRAKPKMPNCVSKEIEEEILRFCFQYPTYGPERIEQELKLRGLSCGHTGYLQCFKEERIKHSQSQIRMGKERKWQGSNC